MPTFRKLSSEELTALQRRGHRSPIDLTEYLDFMRELSPGEGGTLELAEGESQRTVKRRISTATTRLKKDIRWRRSENGVLRFEVR